jgi:hypothetical protein
MGLFKSKREKEFEKKALFKKTIMTMNRQIDQLEQSKTGFIEKAKKARMQGLEPQYQLALTGLKMTLGQQKRAQELLLNYEVFSQMRDVSEMTSNFLKGMSALSKDMIKLTNEKEFERVQQQFEQAMNASERQTMNIEMFMEQSKESFSSQTSKASPVGDSELEKLIMEQATQDEFSADKIDSELESIGKKLKG